MEKDLRTNQKRRARYLKALGQALERKGMMLRTNKLEDRREVRDHMTHINAIKLEVAAAAATSERYQL